MHSLFTAAEFDGEVEQDLSQEDRASQIYKNRQAVVDKINFNVASISIDIVEDLEITGEIGQTMIKNKAKYVRTMSELNIAFMAFCAQVLGGTYERVSVKTLAIALQEAMEELFELFESDAIKVILFRANR